MSDDQGSAPAGNPAATAPAWYAPEGLDPTTTGQLGELVKAKGWKGPADYRVVLITPGPDGWVDPLAGAVAEGEFGEDEEPF
jgi:hypothetical protein